MEQNDHHNAEQHVAATTDSYGGPVSDEELAEVYLPEGQTEVDGGGPSTDDDEPEDATERATRNMVG